MKDREYKIEIHRTVKLSGFVTTVAKTQAGALLKAKRLTPEEINNNIFNNGGWGGGRVVISQDAEHHEIKFGEVVAVSELSE